MEERKKYMQSAFPHLVWVYNVKYLLVASGVQERLEYLWDAWSEYWISVLNKIQYVLGDESLTS